MASCRHYIFFSFSLLFIPQNELDIINDEHDSGTPISTPTVIDGHQDATLPLTVDDDNQGVDGTIPQGDMIKDLPSPINSPDIPDDEQDFGSSLIPPTKEAIWLNRILIVLGARALPVPLRCDNQGAIALIHDPVFHQRTKHIDVRFFFVRDAQAEEKVNISYIETESQLADIFTKALAAPRFEKLRAGLNICEFNC